MQTTNVEYLFENFTVAEIEEIQRKLQVDVDRKKEELKQLVGQRYRDLIEAADTIQDMNKSVEDVLLSINQLQNKVRSIFLLTHTPKPHLVCQTDSNNLIENDYQFGMHMKTLINVPLKIWFFLEAEDILSTTISYLFGKMISKRIEDSPFSCPMSHQYKQAIDRFQQVIENEIWKFFTVKLKEEVLDETTVLDAFSCLLMITQLSTRQLFLKFLENRNVDILKLFAAETNSQQVLFDFLNCIFNTIKVIYLLFFDGTTEDVPNQLQQRFNEIISIPYSVNFCDENLNKSISVGNDFVLNSYVFSFKLNLNVKDNLEKEFVREETSKWMNLLKQSVKPLIEHFLNNFDSIRSICLMLHNINSLLYNNQRKLDWEEFCEVTMENFWPVWDEFLMDDVIRRIFETIDLKITTAFEKLKKNVKEFLADATNIENLKVSVFVWDDLNSKLEQKAKGHLPQIHILCSEFDQDLEILLDDTNLLVSDKLKTPINKQNLIEIKNKLTSISKNQAVDFCKFLEAQTKESSSLSTNQFLAHLLRFISRGSKHFKKCFFVLSENEKFSLDWEEVRENIDEFTVLFFQNLFNSLICKTVENEFKTLNEFSSQPKNLFFEWEKITITDEAEDGKILSSIIEVPIQITFPLHNCFNFLCCQINQIAGHILSKVCLDNILNTLGKELNKKYSHLFEKLSHSDVSSSIKQVYALQCYFDLQFVKQFLTTSHSDSVKNEAVEQIHSCMLSFESLIDPFDLHIFFPHIQTNLVKIGRNFSALFGLLIPEFTLITENKSNSSQIDDSLEFNTYKHIFSELNSKAASYLTQKKY